MTTSTPRRRVLCLRPRPNEEAAGLLLTAADEWVAALEQHADITTVTGAVDIQEACESVQPDLVVIDALHWGRPYPIKIINPRAHPEVPRVLYLNSDPHDPLRVMTMRMAAELGVEAVFFSNEAYRQHMPEMRHVPHYLVPFFIDDGIFRDYGLDKNIPVSIFGGYLLPDFYPWRAKLLEQVQHVFPTLIYTHPGYSKDGNAPFAVQGEAYARLLNQSHFSAADTTRLDYCVRKHLEIPACGAVLIAPASASLASLGFADMKNCVFGEGRELFAKMDHLARTPEDYRRIRDEGAALVYARYTRRQCRGMLDWLDCRLRLKPDQIVQQVGRYGPFRCVTPTGATPSILTAPQRDSDMAAALRMATAAILSGERRDEAAALLSKVGHWAQHIAEPYFLASILVLLEGNPIMAAQGIGLRAQGQGTIDLALATLDPVETAWLLLIARLLGNHELEAAMRDQAAGASHVALRRVFWLLEGCPTGDEPTLIARQTGDLPSVHWLGDEDFTAWGDLIRRVLAANRASPGAHAIARDLGAA